MPLSLKSTGMALLVFEPSSASASPTAWRWTLVQGHPQGVTFFRVQLRQKLTKPWPRRCCKPQPATTYPTSLLSFLPPFLLPSWGLTARESLEWLKSWRKTPSAARSQFYLASAARSLFYLASAGEMSCLGLFFGNTCHCSSEKSMYLSTFGGKGVSLILFAQSLPLKSMLQASDTYLLSFHCISKTSIIMIEAGITN